MFFCLHTKKRAKINLTRKRNIRKRRKNKKQIEIDICLDYVVTLLADPRDARDCSSCIHSVNHPLTDGASKGCHTIKSITKLQKFYYVGLEVTGIFVVSKWISPSDGVALGGSATDVATLSSLFDTNILQIMVNLHTDKIAEK